MPYVHVWFGTKGRKWLLQGDVLTSTREVLRDVAVEKGIHVLELEAIVDHVHLLLELPDKSELPRAMMILKGVSTHHLLQLYPELKLDAHTNSFWQTGYGSKLVPPGAIDSTRSYIRTQWDRLEKYDRGDLMPRGSARGMDLTSRR
ncbi:MAG: IS200/IS605 family transposase [Dehalococcoidia bacterium]|nr:IS200/IS605 family transposase [Dehalococcoidia bacterium]